MAGSVTDDDPLLTIDDIISAGACSGGAYATLRRVASRVSAAMPASEIRKLLKDDEQIYLQRAINPQSDGNGYGNGDGNGNGNGNGNGYGNGDGNGYGNGDGNGYGYGYGNGDGYGDGYGYGNGDGYGDGYGYGEP